MRLDDEIARMAERHPCPAGYTPEKTALGELLDRYGVGNIPLAELHGANSTTLRTYELMKLRQATAARAKAARGFDAMRRDLMAAEWEASHGGR